MTTNSQNRVAKKIIRGCSIFFRGYIYRPKLYSYDRPPSHVLRFYNFYVGHEPANLSDHGSYNFDCAAGNVSDFTGG